MRRLSQTSIENGVLLFKYSKSKARRRHGDLIVESEFNTNEKTFHQQKEKKAKEL